MPQRPLKILFLCTGNSCRSQMAEGYANALGENRIEAKSAGIEAHGKNPRAITVMQEDGVDISMQESTVITDEMLGWADFLITVCGHADENCPVVNTSLERQHWPFDDPAKAKGNEQEIMQEFRRVRDSVKQKIVEYLQSVN